MDDDNGVNFITDLDRAAPQSWLAQQPQKWQDFYREEPMKFLNDYSEVVDNPEMIGLGTGGEPGWGFRDKVFSPHKVNPRGDERVRP